MITWDDFDKIWASTSPLIPYSFSDPNYAQGWNFVGNTPPARQMWDSIQKQNDEKFKYLRDNFGTPNIVTQASQMTDTDKVYVYLGSEAGWNSGHWYYYDAGTSSWADGGVYNSVAFVTDTTLSIAGQPADAKATGDALALKSDLAGCTFTGNVGINADLSVTGDATIGTGLSVTGVSTLTGNVSAGADVTVVGDVSSANLTTSADATIGGDLSVTGASTLAGNITTSGDISADNISATTNGTIGGNLSVTGTSTLTGNINAGADITAVGDVSADNLTTTTNATVGGSLSVAGTSTLTGNVTTNGNISAVGDISSANLTTTNATIGGNATVTGDVSCANLTTSADASVGGDLTVTGDSTLADTTVNNLVVNNDLSVAGDSSLTNLSVSGTTALAGTSTAPTPSADDNSTKIATTQYVQTEIKPIEADVSVNDKRISNIEKLLQGNLYDYQTDSTSAYTKTVPSGAMPYAGVEKICGKTVVMNQLNDNSTTSKTTGNVTIIKDADNRTWTANGTSESNTTYNISSAINYINGHKYLLKGCPSGGSNSTYRLVATNLLGANDEGNGVIVTCSADATGYLRVVIFAGYEAINLAYTPQLHDLTLMFGSGNEPTTVAEFQQMFPASYYPYNAGQLLSAGVTEVVSKGKNLLDLSNAIRGASGYNIYNIPNTLEPNTTYTFTVAGTPDSINSQFGLFMARNNTQTGGGTTVMLANYVNNGSRTFTTPSNMADYPYLLLGGVPRYAAENTTYTFQVEIGSTATSYTPYKAPITYPIPASIQALEGYGWSAGSVYNYIDYERKVFVQRVASVDLGERTWTYNSSYHAFSTNYFVSRAKYSTTDGTLNTNFLAEKFMCTTVANPSSLTNYQFVLGTSGNLWVRTDGTADVTPTGVLNYELATPIEIDISAYLTDDNLISVEAGGTLTFENQHGDDYRIEVPSAETYMVDLQSAI